MAPFPLILQPLPPEILQVDEVPKVLFHRPAFGRCTAKILIGIRQQAVEPEYAPFQPGKDHREMPYGEIEVECPLEPGGLLDHEVKVVGD